MEKKKISISIKTRKLEYLGSKEKLKERTKKKKVIV